MAEFLKSTRRAIRRHHRVRRIQKRMKQEAPYFRDEESLRRYVLRTCDLRRPCSCEICRRYRTRIDGPDHRSLRQMAREFDEG